MRVKEVKLENIRSHVKSDVPFAEGFNCLVGGLGCGKSSVLYAIDFALFGDPLGRSYDYLLREGEDLGKVGVRFVHGGTTYTLYRGLRRKGKGISQDTEQLKLFKEDKLIASAKSEAVEEQLTAITGVDRDLFREVVWIRQEHLKELLDMTPRDRQKKFDQLFGLSDYEVAWSNLATFQRDYGVEKGAYERDFDVVGVDKLQADYNKAVEEFSSIEADLQGLKTKVLEADATLKEATSRLQSLEALRRKNEELRRKEAQLEADVANTEDTCARLSEEIESKKSSVNELEGRLKSMEKQEKSYRHDLQEKAGLEPDQTFEKIRKHLEAIEYQASSIWGEQEATKKEMQSSENRLSTLTTESKCPLCLQNLPDEYKKKLLRRLQEENAEREKRLTELQRDLDELEKLRGIINPILSSLQSLMPRMEELRSQHSRENKSLSKLQTEFAEKQQREKLLRDQLSLTRKEIAKFDISELETVRRLHDTSLEQYSALKSKLEAVESRKKDVTLRMDNVRERLDHAQQKIERMRRIERILEVIDGVRGVYRSIQPKLRSEFVTYLQRTVQQILDGLVGGEGPMLSVSIDETYTPFVKSEEGYERDVTNLSGGERTILAFAYRIGLGQLIMQSRTGHGLYMLLLDEPTESLGREDGSIDRLAEAISRLKAIEQIIAVTHNEAFAEKAEHVIRFEKEAGVSKVSVER